MAAALGPALALHPAVGAFQAGCIVPVPLHPGRFRQRGYNQAELLARPLQAILGAPCLPEALQRVRSTGAQVRFGPGQRAKNLAGAFHAPVPEVLKSRRVLLVDDVVTTGATLKAAVEAVRLAGASEIFSVALARA